MKKLVMSLFTVGFIIFLSLPADISAQTMENGKSQAENSDQAISAHAGNIRMPSADTPETGSVEPVGAGKLTEKDARYWFEKGSLYATYGNKNAAIKAFEKAISLDSAVH